MPNARASLAVAVAASLLGAACSSSPSAPPPDAAPPGPNTPPEWNRQVTPPPDVAAAAGRAACTYKAGALPAETQGQSIPSGDAIPVDHVVVVMMENRSFDHYFQKAPAQGIEVDVAPATFANPDPKGKPVPIFHDQRYCFVDTAHAWNGVHRQIDGGKMDGFVVSNEGDGNVPPGGTAADVKGNRAMAYYDETDIPFTYWVAKNYAIADRYFASVPGPTWPNRMFLYAATSFGETSNTLPPTVDHTLFDYLDERGVSWTIYFTTTPGFAILLNSYLALKEGHTADISQFYADAAAGTLPQVAFVDPDLANEGYGGQDEHPPGVMQIGQQWLAKVADAVKKSPSWSRSALFVTYDEHGGLYDHVVPPKACPPDDRPTQTTPEYPKAGFDEYGIRVPFLVISPFAKKHYVGHHVYDHTSIDRFIEARFTIPALTNRDANAEGPWDLFDFQNPPNATPPAVPIPEVDERKVAACKAIFAP